MALRYTNKTFDELLSLFPDPAVKEAFEEWNERKKDKLAPYVVSLDGTPVKAFGDLSFFDGQKNINYETTYGDVIVLRGKRRPKTIPLNFLIEYDHDLNNLDQMKAQIKELELIKKERRAISFSVSEIGVEYRVTIEQLNTTYKGVRDIYVQAELMEVYENDSNN